MNFELKPCPFCGSVHLSVLDYESRYRVECNFCKARTGIWDSKAEAIEEWNRRVGFKLTSEEIEELHKKFSSAILDIPASYYMEVRKPYVDKCVEPAFTPDELDAIRRNVRDWRAERELSKIEQAIIDKCDAVLKGESND